MPSVLLRQLKQTLRGICPQSSFLASPSVTLLKVSLLWLLRKTVPAGRMNSVPEGDKYEASFWPPVTTESQGIFLVEKLVWVGGSGYGPLLQKVSR